MLDVLIAFGILFFGGIFCFGIFGAFVNMLAEIIPNEVIERIK